MKQSGKGKMAFFGDDSDEEKGQSRRPDLHSDDNVEQAFVSARGRKMTETEPASPVFKAGTNHSSKRPRFAETKKRESRAESKAVTKKKGSEDHEDDDDLDAYMEQINKQAIDHASKRRESPNPFEKEDEDDPVTSYIAFRKEKEEEAALHNAATEADGGPDGMGDAQEDSEEDLENSTRKKRNIEDLPELDHQAIEYPAFRKDFYVPHPDIAALSARDVQLLRDELGIKVSGRGEIPSPVRIFSEVTSLGRELLDAIHRHGYDVPTEIQSQALPVILEGRDVIGIAKTGSGKTAAFVLPLLVHALDQPHVRQSEGPIGLIVAPTRELAGQIAQEVKRFGKALGMKVTLVVGGDPKFEQFKALRDGGAEIVVGTPGRLLDMVKMKACSFRRCTYLVLDEADRMFDMGFEPQVRSVIGQIRPDRQTLLFSATFKPNVERLASTALNDPNQLEDLNVDPDTTATNNSSILCHNNGISYGSKDVAAMGGCCVRIDIRIAVGAVGAANVNVTQIVEVFGRDNEKFEWLVNTIPRLVKEGSIVIFALTRGSCAELANKLRASGFATCSIHGDTDQADRDGMLRMFKKQEVSLLVATDVAARGLDIKHVKNVVNYEPAKNMDWHTHRIGRTGRAGEKGTAYTLLTPKNSSFAEQLMRSFQRSNIHVPPALSALASRKSSAGGGRGGGGGGGAGRGGGGGGSGGGRRGAAKISFNFVKGGDS